MLATQVDQPNQIIEPPKPTEDEELFDMVADFETLKDDTRKKKIERI